MFLSHKDTPVHAAGRHVIGIDIGLRSHVAAAVTSQGVDFGRRLSFENNHSGLEQLEIQLLHPLGGPPGVLIGLEATGHYWLPVYFDLTRRNYEVVVINPLQTRAKFRTRIRKTKTDALDARSIARLMLSGEVRAARVPSERTFSLRLKVRHRWRLVDLSSDLERFAYSLIDRLFPEFNGHFYSLLNNSARALIREFGLSPNAVARHPDETCDLIRRSSRGKVSKDKIQALIDKARTSIGIRCGEDAIISNLRDTLSLIEAIEAQVSRLDSEFELLPEVQSSPLRSLKIRSALIATIHAESDPISDFQHPWQFAAYAGLDPSTCDSGQMHGTRTHISKRGSPYLRHALFLTACVAYRRFKPFQRLYQIHRKKGRHHTYALVVVAHKVARVVWRMLTDNRDFRVNAPRC